MPSLRHLAPILPVHSMPRAIAFYRTLGFAATPYRDADEYAFLTRDELHLHLRRAPDLPPGENPCGVYFYLETGTAADLEAEFRAAGATVLSALSAREWKMLEFALSDPDGNLLRFGEPA